MVQCVPDYADFRMITPIFKNLPAGRDCTDQYNLNLSNQKCEQGEHFVGCKIY